MIRLAFIVRSTVSINCVKLPQMKGADCRADEGLCELAQDCLTASNLSLLIAL
ncbi:hypothetical protein [Cylindrospermum stagnale]|uniref:hypothetical protein n=1 Tax=Cylindrospermum stagnale TaxID=142864 RepID=UPI0002F88AF5|nr:hypothetical protein [Cylindrospermum stagnale]